MLKFPSFPRFFWSFTLIAVLSSFAISGNTDWKETKKEEDITVYLRNVSHSKFKEVKCVTKVKSNLTGIVALMLDEKAATEWIYKIEKSELLEKLNETAYVYYSVFDVPGKNRDVIALTKIEQDAGSKVVTIKTESWHDYNPAAKGLIRVEVVKGSTTLIPLGNGEVEIIQKMHTEPGGWVPAWIVNMFLDSGPIETFTKFKEVLPRYQSAQLDFIQEP